MKKLRMILFTILILIIGGYDSVQASEVSSVSASMNMSSAFLSNSQRDQSSLDNPNNAIDIDQLLDSQSQKFQAGQQVTVLLPDGTYSGKSKTVNITVKGKKMADMKLSDGSEYAEVTFLAQMTGGAVAQYIASFESYNFLLFPPCNCNDKKSSTNSSQFASKAFSSAQITSKSVQSSSIKGSSKKVIPCSSSTGVSKSLRRSSGRRSVIHSSLACPPYKGVIKQPIYRISHRSFRISLHSFSKSKCSKRFESIPYGGKANLSSQHYKLHSCYRKSSIVNNSSSVSSQRPQQMSVVPFSTFSSKTSSHYSRIVHDNGNYESSDSLLIAPYPQMFPMMGLKIFSHSDLNASNSELPLVGFPRLHVYANHKGNNLAVAHHHRHKHIHATHHLAIRGILPETRMDPYTGLYSLIGLIIVIISGRALVSKKDKED